MDKAAEGKERQGWMESWRVVVVVVVMVEGGGEGDKQQQLT